MAIPTLRARGNNQSRSIYETRNRNAHCVKFIAYSDRINVTAYRMKAIHRLVEI